MSSLLIIGELGEPFSASSQNEFQTQYLCYLKSTKLDASEISIFNSKGQLIELTNVIDFSQESRYYLYTKTYQKEIISKLFEDSIHSLSCKTQISLDQNSLPDVHTNFSLLEENANMFKGITPFEIKETYERMLEFFENYKVYDTTMKLNGIICDKIKGNYQYQYCGINALIKNMNMLVDSTDSARQELKQEYNKLIEMKDSCIRNLYDSIEKLKTSELHPKMQSKNKRYLIDVYYDEKKMIQTKDKIVDQFNTLSESIQEKTNMFLIESNRVLNEKSTSISEIKFEWSSIGSEYDKIFKDADNLPMNIINDLTNEFLQFKKAIINIIDILTNKNDNANGNANANANANANLIDESIDIIKMLKLKYSNFSLLGSLQKLLDPMNNYCSKMRKSMEKFPQAINSIYNNFQEIKSSFSVLCAKYAQDKKVAENLIESFSMLKYASYFPQAYQASINEVKRRLVFNNKMRKDIDNVKKIYNQEIALRKKFITQYGNNFPSDFMRILKYYEMTFIAEFSTDEIEELPNLLNEDEEKYILSTLNQEDSANNHSNNSSNMNANDKEIKKRDKQLKQLQLNIEKYTSTLYYYLKNAAIKDSILKEKINECDNLSKYKLSNNKANNPQSLNCPMCIESSLNSVEYQSVAMFYSGMKKKYKEKENQLVIIEKQFQELISQVIQVKTAFFIHMNTIIANKNAEIANMSTSYKNRVKNLEELLLTERLKNAKDINININNIEDNNQYEKQIKEYNRLISIYQSDNNKKQKTIEEEKNKNSLLTKENKTSISSLEENRLTIQQLISNSEVLSKKYNDVAEELLNTIKINAMLKEQNEALNKDIAEMRNECNQLKETNMSKFNEFQLQKRKYEVIIKEKAEKIDEMIELVKILKKYDGVMQTNHHHYTISPNVDMSIEGKGSGLDIIHYKSIDKGLLCVFVPHSEGVYVCVNLSEKININDESDKDTSYYKCKYVLDLDSFKEDLKELIIENSLIIIGTIGEMNTYDSSIHPKMTLPHDTNNSSLSCIIVSLSSIEYIIGFPGEELLFKNYNYD